MDRGVYEDLGLLIVGVVTLAAVLVRDHRAARSTSHDRHPLHAPAPS
jgi:hypothetical protein